MTVNGAPGRVCWYTVPTPQCSCWSVLLLVCGYFIGLIVIQPWNFQAEHLCQCPYEEHVHIFFTSPFQKYINLSQKPLVDFSLVLIGQGCIMHIPWLDRSRAYGREETYLKFSLAEGNIRVPFWSHPNLMIIPYCDNVWFW